MKQGISIIPQGLIRNGDLVQDRYDVYLEHLWLGVIESRGPLSESIYIFRARPLFGCGILKHESIMDKFREQTGKEIN